MTPSIILICGLLCFLSAIIVVTNERMARRNSVMPHIVLGNTIAASVMIVTGILLVLMSIVVAA